MKNKIIFGVLLLYQIVNQVFGNFIDICWVVNQFVGRYAKCCLEMMATMK